MKRVVVKRGLALALGGALVLAAAAIASPSGAAVSESRGGRVQVFGMVGEQRVPVVVGSVFAQAVRDDEGNCRVEVPIGVSIEILGDDRSEATGGRAPTVTWSFDDSCRAVVESIDSTASVQPMAPPSDGTWVTPTDPGITTDAGTGTVSPMHAAAAHRHTGWAKSTVLEQFGFTATEVYAEMRYWQNRNKVYDGFGRDGWCYHSGWPSWTINSCRYSEWNPNGPSEVRVAVIGDFTNTSVPDTTISYAHRARFVAVHPNFWANQCHLTRGSLPVFWDLRCAGGRSGGW